LHYLIGLFVPELRHQLGGLGVADAALMPVFVRFPLAAPRWASQQVLAWMIRAGGRVSAPNVTTDFNPFVQFGSSITAASNKTLATLPVRSYASGSANWFFESYHTWDSTPETSAAVP
jgi:hypothetical protein